MTKNYGITNRQAKYLAYLCKRLDIPYTGHGMKVWEAGQEIERMRERVKEAAAVAAAAPAGTEGRTGGRASGASHIPRRSHDRNVGATARM